MSSYHSLSISKRDQFAQTPCWLLKHLTNIFGPLHDPCPENPSTDGLRIRWKKRNYVNPPYNDVGTWLEKAIHEQQVYNALSVFLVPFRMHTSYMRKALPYIDQVVLLKHPITFKGYNTPLAIPLCFLVIGKGPKIPVCARLRCSLMSPKTLHEFKTALHNKFSTSVQTIHNKVSGPLAKLVTKSPQNTSIICPTRMLNRVIQRAVLQSSHVVFCNPTLSSKSGKFIEGTCAIVYNPLRHRCWFGVGVSDIKRPLNN